MKVESVLTNDGQKKGQHAKMQVKADFNFYNETISTASLIVRLSV